MRIGACEVCAAKDEIITDLRRQLEETHKTLLATVDARAYAVRYPATPPVREAAPAKAPDTRDQRRFRLYEPEASIAAVEALFDADRELERKLATSGGNGS